MSASRRNAKQHIPLPPSLKTAESQRIFGEAVTADRELYFPNSGKRSMPRKKTPVGQHILSSAKFAAFGFSAIAVMFAVSNQDGSKVVPPGVSLETTASTPPPAVTKPVALPQPAARMMPDVAPVSPEPVIQTVALLPQPDPFPSVSSLVPDLSRLPDCVTIAPPPRSLGTASKYIQSDPTRSTIDEVALVARNQIMAPLRDSVRVLTQIAYAESRDVALQASRATCVLRNLTSWARAGSLTEMQTTDAVLDRDRFIAEITLSLMQAAKIRPMGPEEMAAILPWLQAIGDDTIRNYTFNVGKKSQSNNHRYWAGLAVAAVGYVTGRRDLVQWGRDSFEIGLCEIESSGYLPLELQRGSKALQYHVYALRPLLAMEKLVTEQGDGIATQCGERLQLLRNRTITALKDKSEIEALSGYVQELSSDDRSFSKGLQLAALGLTPH